MIFKIIYLLLFLGFLVFNFISAVSNPKYDSGTFVGSLVFTAAVFFYIFCIHLFYIICSAQMRRREAARSFLDLIRLGIRNGKSPEQTVTELSRQEDHELGETFDKVATSISFGENFADALRRDKFMPENIIGAFEVGALCGDVRKILPACYESLKQYQSRSRAMINYLLPFMILFFTSLLLLFLKTFIQPKMDKVIEEMEGSSLSLIEMNWMFYAPPAVFAVMFLCAFFSALASSRRSDAPDVQPELPRGKTMSARQFFALIIYPSLAFISAAILLAMMRDRLPNLCMSIFLAATMLYFALIITLVFFFELIDIAILSLSYFNRITNSIFRLIICPAESLSASGPWGFVDYIHYYMIPWRRNRLRGAFASMLTILLDAGIPEAEALTAAAKSTGNRAMLGLARRGTKLLEQGYLLPDVLTGLFDNRGELAWRMCNSRHKDSSLSSQIRGWCSFLEASAFRSEQAFAHLMSTAIILCLGALVGLVAIGLFAGLISITTSLALW